MLQYWKSIYTKSIIILILILSVLSYFENRIVFSKGYINAEAYVYEVKNTAPKGGCTIFYLYKYKKRIYQSFLSWPGARCQGNYYKGQVLLTKVSVLEPIRNHLKLDEHLVSKRINTDSLLQEYIHQQEKGN